MLRVISRAKHSKRQVKRMNFPRLRQEIINRPPPVIPPELPKPDGELANGWTPPPDTIPTDKEFAVLRTKNGWLPVYVTYKKNVAWTKVRHVIGDAKAFMAHIDDAMSLAATHNEQGAASSVLIKGNHVTNVRRWLVSLGF